VVAHTALRGDVVIFDGPYSLAAQAGIAHLVGRIRQADPPSARNDIRRSTYPEERQHAKTSVVVVGLRTEFGKTAEAVEHRRAALAFNRKLGMSSALTRTCDRLAHASA
jgi:hypothetical protein